MERVILAEILHGSHLFGTAGPGSDMDFKSVVIPAPREILFGRTDWSSNDGMPDGSGDDDRESHDLLRFVRLLEAGQPMALEMLFAPDAFHRAEPHAVWEAMRGNMDRIVSKTSSKFAGYCRRQALVYGMKGERVAAAEAAAAELGEIVRENPQGAVLGPFMQRVVDAAGSPHVRLETRTMESGRVLMHLSVAERLVPETATVTTARDLARKVVSAYGARARRAMEAGGRDLKALSHALRIGYEAVELFRTGRITLPRPEAEYLLAVRQGRTDVEETGREVTALLETVEAEALASSLPDVPDADFLEGLVFDAYGAAVAAAVRTPPDGVDRCPPR